MGKNSVRTGIFGIEWIGSIGVNVVLSGPQVQPAPEKTYPRKNQVRKDGAPKIVLEVKPSPPSTILMGSGGFVFAPKPFHFCN